MRWIGPRLKWKQVLSVELEWHVEPAVAELAGVPQQTCAL